MEHRSIIAGYATIGQGAGPLIVAERAGLFVKHGLDVTTRLMGGAKGVVKGLMDGAIQFGNLAAPALLRADLQESADLVFLTGGINQQFLVGRPGIKDRSELGGARIGFVGDGGLNDVLVRFIVEELNKKGIRDIRLAPLQGASRQNVGALLARDCDALVMTPPEAIEARRCGCAFVVDFAEFGLNYALGGIAARHRTIQDDPETARRFVRAYVQGMRRYRGDREFTVKIQQEYSRIADKTVAEETYDLTQPGMPEIPYPVASALAIALEVMAKDLPAAAEADPQRFIDDCFIRELANSAPA